MMTSLQETEYVCTTLDLAIVPPLEVVETDSNLCEYGVSVTLAIFSLFLLPTDIKFC